MRTKFSQASLVQTCASLHIAIFTKHLILMLNTGDAKKKMILGTIEKVGDKVNALQERLRWS